MDEQEPGLIIQTPKTRSALHDVVTREYTIHLHKRTHDLSFKKSGFLLPSCPSPPAEKRDILWTSKGRGCRLRDARGEEKSESGQVG